MDTSTWTGVAVGLTLIFLALMIFVMSLVPGLFGKIRDELSSWPDQARELRRDVRTWWHFHGRHATGAPVHDQIECYEGPCAEIGDGGGVIIHPDGTEEPVGPNRPQKEHVGATEEWSPHAQLAAALPEWAVSRTEPDSEERRILLAFESVVGQLHHVPDEYVLFAASVDAALADAGLNGEAHKRWRATTFDVPTGEYRLVLASA